MKSKNIVIKSAIGGLSLFLLLSGNFSNHFEGYKNVRKSLSNNIPETYEKYIEGCEEVNNALLKAKISKSNDAPTSKFLQVSFETIVPKAFSNSDEDYYVNVTSPEYTGDTADYKAGDNKEFEGEIVRVINRPAKNGGTIYIAETMKFGSRFTITNTSIASNVMFNEDESKMYEGLTAIYIPKSISYIASGAFVNCPDNLHFYLDFNSNDFLHILEDDWCDALSSNIHFTDSDVPAVFPQGKEYTSNFNVNTTTPNKLSGFSDESFILNYSGLHTEHFDIPSYPLIYSYKLVDSNEIFFNEVELQSKINIYDGVGSQISGTETTLELTLNFSEGEEVDTTSLKFYNIHLAKWVSNLDADLITNPEAGLFIPSNCELDPDSNKYVPSDFEEKYFLDCGISKNCQNVSVDQVINYSYVGLAKFSDYFTVSWNVGKVLPSIYEQEGYGKSYIEQYASSFEEGKYVIRYGLTSLSNVILNISYESNGELKTAQSKIKTDDGIVEIWDEHKNVVTFLVENSSVGDDFNVDKIRSIFVDRITITLDSYDTSGHQKVKGTSVEIKFGNLEVMPLHSRTPKYTNINLIVILTFALFVPIYCLIAFLLFIVCKNKFKNDEFRRINPKKFLKKALIGLAGGLVILGMILFIVCRFGLFANSISTFNPLDIFVVFFSLVGVVVFGLFVKYAIVTLKSSKQRRAAIRLHMNDDEDDDGTK